MLSLAAAAGVAFATLAAAAGVLFCDRTLVRLEAAIPERNTPQAELDAAHRTTKEFRGLVYLDGEAQSGVDAASVTVLRCLGPTKDDFSDSSAGGHLRTDACIGAVQEREPAAP